MSKNDAEREKRLAEALRANLRRRKAQARGDAPTEADEQLAEKDQPSSGRH